MASRDDGFTLLETLIALAILAGALATLQQALGAGWKGLRAARSEIGAVEHARAQLAAAGVATNLREGQTEGVTPDGYRWQVTIVPVAAEARPRSTTAPKFAGYWVTAAVRWQSGSGLAGGRAVTLRTLKIGAPPQ